MARAILFDFNGTLSADEHIMYEVVAELYAGEGRPISHAEYLDRLAGIPDDVAVRMWLGDRDDIDALVTRRIDGYRRRVQDGATVTDAVRTAVRTAATEVPVGIVSGAARAEIEPVIRAAGLEEMFAVVVTADDVAEGKPHPEGYVQALERLRAVVPGLEAREVTVLEDTEAGVRSAKAAGMRVVALASTLPADRLGEADELADTIDRCLVRRLLLS
jgi:beta-phosphoglucomutase-like phosphatase (HAD superfamily)